MVGVPVLAVLVAAVAKVPVWAASIMNSVVTLEVLDIVALNELEIIVVGAIVIALKFAWPISYPPGAAVDVLMDAFPGTMLGVLPQIGISVLTDLSKNAFAVVITALEFPVPTPLRAFSREVTFDLALLDCTRVLQTWIPSYHV